MLRKSSSREPSPTFFPSDRRTKIGWRKLQIAEIVVDRINTITSYAAADPKARSTYSNFYQTVSIDSASKMFEGFVLSWLYACPGVKPLRCFSTDQVGLEIPACGEEQTTSKNFPTADANRYRQRVHHYGPGDRLCPAQRKGRGLHYYQRSHSSTPQKRQLAPRVYHRW
ncbi:hypothetical protein EDB86DRAFT_2893656 [Lactarius hatsudake]|nr:hypothetical protein EDB86DRAFT_2893656 [Lactarius hatsudake]